MKVSITNNEADNLINVDNNVGESISFAYELNESSTAFINDVDPEDAVNMLKAMRLSNINKLIVGSLNINSISGKFEQLKTVINGNIDILLVVETKLDATFPESQFVIEGYSAPYRLDGNRNGGGILIYVREDIPSKKLSKHNFPDDIEGFFIEINLRKTKWLIFGSYHPPSQSDQYYFDNVGQALDTYNSTYEKSLLVGDFNVEERDACSMDFMYQYDLKLRKKLALSL